MVCRKLVSGRVEQLASLGAVMRLSLPAMLCEILISRYIAYYVKG